MSVLDVDDVRVFFLFFLFAFDLIDRRIIIVVVDVLALRHIVNDRWRDLRHQRGISGRKLRLLLALRRLIMLVAFAVFIGRLVGLRAIERILVAIPSALVRQRLPAPASRSAAALIASAATTTTSASSTTTPTVRTRTKLRRVRRLIRREPELFDEHHPVARIKQVKLHLVQPERLIRTNDDPLAGLMLQRGERAAFLVRR
jgi:hypothetical protein